MPTRLFAGVGDYPCYVGILTVKLSIFSCTAFLWVFLHYFLEITIIISWHAQIIISGGKSVSHGQ